MKIKPLNIFVSALVTISAFFFASGLCLAEEKSITQAVTISALAGKVEVLPKDALDWKEAEIGMQLNEGDKIKTTEDGKAELIFQDGSFIRMKPNTTLGVRTLRQEVSAEVTHYNLELRVGEIMAEVRKLKKGSSFEVETPTAVAAVRGTTYYMRAGTRIVDGVEKSFVELYVDSEDTILFTSTVSGDSFIVSQGQGAIVFGDGAVEGPFDIPPSAQDAWKSGFDMYDDSDGSKGMRDVGDEDADDDTSGDVDDTTAGQDDALNGANDDRSGEQDIYGLANVTIITDTDDDGIPDDLDTDDDNDGYTDTDETDNTTDPKDATSVPPDNDLDYVSDLNDSDDDNDDIMDLWEKTCEINETNYNTNYLLADTDSDGIDDFEDAFPNDAYDPEVDKGYGSWAELREAALTIGNLKQDVGAMIDDIHARGFEAAKENIFDHQAGKVMRDRWGNRVRVEEYVSRPTNNQVQILALNLRTAGPNTGISSMDFRVTFDDDISNANLKTLPWDDYMHNPQNEDFDWSSGEPNVDDEAQLILYEKDNPGYYNPKDEAYNYPIPLEFSLEVKNPYGESVKATESYYIEDNDEYLYEGEIKGKGEGGPFRHCWYQIEENFNIAINGIDKEYSEERWEDDWGGDWNDKNRFTFIDHFTDNSWLIGIFYLIGNDGELVSVEEGKDSLENMQGIRDCINPDYNLEMVFFSSEFGKLPSNSLYYSSIMANGVEKTDEDGATGREEYLYNTYRSIDVITIPEITEPYYTHTPLFEGTVAE